MHLADGLTLRQLDVIDVCSANIQTGEAGEMFNIKRTGNSRIFQWETLHLHGWDVQLVRSERSCILTAALIGVYDCRLCNELNKPFSLHLKRHVRRYADVADVSDASIVVDAEDRQTCVVGFSISEVQQVVFIRRHTHMGVDGSLTEHTSRIDVLVGLYMERITVIWGRFIRKVESLQREWISSVGNTDVIGLTSIV